MPAILGAERKRTLKGEIEDQTRNEGQRRCDPQVDSKHFMQQYQKAKVDGERSPSHQEKLDQVAALYDANKFGTVRLGAIPEPDVPVGCLQTAPRCRCLDSCLPSLGNCTRTRFLLKAPVASMRDDRGHPKVPAAPPLEKETHHEERRYRAAAILAVDSFRTAVSVEEIDAPLI